jgi:hypothetical protein
MSILSLDDKQLAAKINEVIDRFKSRKIYLTPQSSSRRDMDYLCPDNKFDLDIIRTTVERLPLYFRRSGNFRNFRTIKDSYTNYYFMDNKYFRNRQDGEIWERKEELRIINELKDREEKKELVPLSVYRTQILMEEEKLRDDDPYMKNLSGANFVMSCLLLNYECKFVYPRDSGHCTVKIKDNAFGSLLGQINREPYYRRLKFYDDIKKSIQPKLIHLGGRGSSYANGFYYCIDKNEIRWRSDLQENYFGIVPKRNANKKCINTETFQLQNPYTLFTNDNLQNRLPIRIYYTRHGFRKPNVKEVFQAFEKYLIFQIFMKLIFFSKFNKMLWAPYNLGGAQTKRQLFKLVS